MIILKGTQVCGVFMDIGYILKGIRFTSKFQHTLRQVKTYSPAPDSNTHRKSLIY